MRKLLVLALCLAAALFSGGCAYTKVKRVKSDDWCSGGVRYFLSAPVLLVKAPVEVYRTEEFEALDAAEADAMLRLHSLLAEGEKPKDKEKEPAKEEGDDNEKKGDAAKGDEGNVVITWLPDYCQEYAATQITILSTQKFGLKVNNSQLDSINIEVDSTGLASKVLDTVAGVIGAGKEAAKEGAKGAAFTADLERLMGEGKKRVLVKKTTITYLKPGLYPLVIYGTDFEKPDCQQPARLAIKHIAAGENLTESVLRAPLPEKLNPAAARGSRPRPH